MYSRLSTSLVAEAIGTFALIFIGAGSVAISGNLVGIALAHGLVIVGFAYAYGHISGAHVNPAVTLAVWAAGKIDAVRAAAYVVVQLAGGILGALALRWVLGGTGTGLGTTHLAQGLDLHGTPVTVTPVVGLFVEAVLTFFLANAVMNAGISGKATIPGGLAIGLTLTFCILMGGPLTGASLNPARTLGPAVAAGSFEDIWVYFVGPAAGGLAAGLLYKGVLADRE
ncbi:MAG TPA: aquaporin [Thermoanaerobaculia bacterium]|jgi:MIP family channel proteins|nr:aquaporin [Thermoanaerobaculia bacterium]